jgi:hypothetical protein
MGLLIRLTLSRAGPQEFIMGETSKQSTVFYKANAYGHQSLRKVGQEKLVTFVRQRRRQSAYRRFTRNAARSWDRLEPPFERADNKPAPPSPPNQWGLQRKSRDR